MQIKGFILESTISFFLMFNSFTTNLHPYFISVTEIRLSPEKKMISVSCKMFTDDLQNALNKLNKTPVDMMKKSSKVDSLVNFYVKARLEVSVGDKKIVFHYLGYEIEEEATWCYFESKLPSDEKVVSVKSFILYDFIESQTNFLHCYYNEERKSFKLDNPNQSAIFKF
jgi:hypothetical protein